MMCAVIVTLPKPGEAGDTWEYKLLLDELGEAAVPPLAALLNGAEAADRLKAATMLATLGARSRGALAALAAHLGDPDDAVARQCAAALVAIGAPARTAIERARSHGSLRARRWAGIALLKLAAPLVPGSHRYHGPLPEALNL